MPIVKDVGYCDNPKCDELQQPLVKCESAKCEHQKKGVHYHCGKCGELLGFASEIKRGIYA
jgi:hypothetical protein